MVHFWARPCETKNASRPDRSALRRSCFARALAICRWTARGFILVGAGHKTVAASVRWRSYCLSAPPPNRCIPFQPRVLSKRYFNGLLVHRIAGIYSGRGLSKVGMGNQ
jgi:hypothetical protein